MLEIKNLTKIYKTKGGVEVKALDNVSTVFPETGMVFLLGKSGSGKSTLLNISGGLDNPTTGEIIVKGRSSKNFKQSDFDSYRNTFVGFIFQEYNILDEFTVEDNIALALELQGKEKDKTAINELLEKVDLKGYNSRKPNTLSGGQKQRLAIARALIKKPEIIMADEPTGALDSKTGEQVFDTLKKLSEDTLIIVVSHDRDFAEKYADRIIELKDGQVISDLTNEGNGFQETIKENIKLKKYESQDSNFINSKFPSRHAIRMGLSSLKSKPFRLVMTILLCTISFALFGTLSTVVFYNKEATFKETLLDSNMTLIPLSKEFTYNEENYFSGEKKNSLTVATYGKFTETEFQEFVKEYGQDTFAAINVDTSFHIIDGSSKYWINKITSAGYLNESSAYRQDMLGKYPEKEDEIAISSYIANVILNCKMDDEETGKTLEISKIEDIIGKKIKIADVKYTITGIVDSGEIDSKYDELKTADSVDENLYVEYQNMLLDGLYGFIFTTKDNLGSMRNISFDHAANILFPRSAYFAISKDGKYEMPDYPNANYNSDANIGNDYEILKLKDYDNLKENQVIVNQNIFGELILKHYETGIYDEKTVEITDLAWSLTSGQKIIRTETEEYYKNLTLKEMSELTNKLYNLVKDNGINFSIGLKTAKQGDYVALGETFELEVVGILISGNLSNANLILNDSLYDKLTKTHIDNSDYLSEIETKYTHNGVYDSIYIPYDGSEEEVEHLWNISSNEVYDDNDTRLRVSSITIETLNTVDNFIRNLAGAFVWVATILAVFAALLFSNFISVSISNKKREIGILRAIGARGKDVFKIFFSESFVISIICVLTSSVVSIILCNVLNNSLDFGAKILVFGLLSFIVIMLISVVIAFIATFVPVYFTVRKKPVDTIRAL